MRIQLTIGTSTATARLYDNATAQDFAALLPVRVSLYDFGGREKAGALPRKLLRSNGQSSYRAGQLGYWAPSNDLAIYYSEDGFRIPSPGVVMIGELDSGLDIITNAEDNATLIMAAVEPIQVAG